MGDPLKQLKESSSAAKVDIIELKKEQPNDPNITELEKRVDEIVAADATLQLLHPEAVSEVTDLGTQQATVQDKVDVQTGKLDTAQKEEEHQRAEKWKWIVITIGVVGLTVTFFIFRTALKAYLPFLP